MVTQFKDNYFERQFYLYDQKEAIAEYKRLYYIPSLESKLALVVNNPGQWKNKSENNPILPALKLLHFEIRQELNEVGAESLPEVDNLVIGKVDSTVYLKTAHFLRVLKEYYNKRFNSAVREREALVATMTDTPEKQEAFDKLKLRYQNEEVTLMVENLNAPKRIVEWNGELLQKIYPIYAQDSKPKSSIDFRASFYSPAKPFLGAYFDTLYFNISVIWVMTILLYITLYFEVLKKMVNSYEMYRKYRRRWIRIET